MKRTLAALVAAVSLHAAQVSAGEGGMKPMSTVEGAIAGLDGCSGKAWSMCPAYVELESYGAKAVPEMVASLQAQRSLPTHALLELIVTAAPKNSGIGTQLVVLATRLTDDLAAAYYQAAVKIDGQRAFDALVAQFERADMARGRALMKGMAELRQPALAFVAARLPRATDPVGLADLAVEVAGVAGDRELLAELVNTTRNRRAQIRLASTAIELGLATEGLFDVAYAGLTSDDPVVRSDTRERFSASSIPVDLVSKFRAVYEAHAKTVTLDHSLARQLLLLGSTDRAAFELQLGGLTSSHVGTRIMTAMSIRTYAPRLAPELAAELDKRVTSTLLTATGRFQVELAKGQAALRAALT